MYKANQENHKFYLSVIAASVPTGVVAINYSFSTTVISAVCFGLLVVGFNKLFLR